MYLKGFSIRKIAKITGFSKSKVHRILKGEFGEQNLKKDMELYRRLSDGLKEKIRLLLTTRTEEKGQSRVLSYSQIYDFLVLDFIQENLKISKARFYQFIKYFIIREFGSLEKLEQQRRLKREISKFIQSKGSVKRELGLWEIDATGYIYNGKNYSIMQVIDTFTGYVFPSMIVENKEKNAKHYNKAFNSLDVAYYLMTLFIQYGVPKAIKSDNEKIIKNDYITEALKELKVKHIKTKPYSPNSKVIERFFRELKDTARMLRAAGFEGEFNELWHKSIEWFNKKEHNFKHINGQFSPLELVNVYGLGTREEKEDIIRMAFAEKFTRKIINNQIRIEGLIYDFTLPKEDNQLGRKKKYKEVIVYRDLENITNLFVYDAETGEYLGVAKLTTQANPQSLETITDKQIKQKQKRIERRVKKLEEEKTLLGIEAMELSNDNEIGKSLIETETDDFETEAELDKTEIELEENQSSQSDNDDLNIFENLIEEEF
ncbi:MAG: transposase [Aquificae bacterium]|nr:transposase [Aquificota bacterium]